MRTQGILAVALTLYEYHHRQKGAPLDAAALTNDGLSSFFRELVYGKARYILPAVLLTLAHTTLAFAYTAKSTYICPLATFWATSARWLQVLGILLDAWIVVSVLKLLQEASDSQSATIRLSQIFLVRASRLGV